MKTHFPQRNKKSPFQRKAVYVFGIFITGAILFSFLDGVFLRIATPVWKGENKLAESFWHLVGLLRDKNDLLRENEALRQKVLADNRLLATFRLNQNQYEFLLQTFGRSASTTSVAASVLAHPPQTPYDVILVDAGSQNGVNLGDIALLPEGGVIGRVVEVFKKTSRVELFTISGKNTNAVLERGNLPIVLRGRGGGDFEFKLPREEIVEVGDRILSPTLDAPLIGVVRDIEVTPTDSFKTVLVESGASVFTLRYIIIHI